MQADASTIEALLERVEKATGPDRVLDAHLMCAVNGYVMHEDSDPAEGIFAFWSGEPWKSECSNCTSWAEVTASIDAALALVQEKLPGWFVSLDFNGRNIGNFARVYNDGLVHEPSFTSTGNKPIELLALAALLEALIAQAKEQGR